MVVSDVVNQINNVFNLYNTMSAISSSIASGDSEKHCLVADEYLLNEQKLSDTVSIGISAKNFQFKKPDCSVSDNQSPKDKMKSDDSKELENITVFEIPDHVIHEIKCKETRKYTGDSMSLNTLTSMTPLVNKKSFNFCEKNDLSEFGTNV